MQEPLGTIVLLMSHGISVVVDKNDDVPGVVTELVDTIPGVAGKVDVQVVDGGSVVASNKR